MVPAGTKEDEAAWRGAGPEVGFPNRGALTACFFNLLAEDSLPR